MFKRIFAAALFFITIQVHAQTSDQYQAILNKFIQFPYQAPNPKLPSYVDSSRIATTLGQCAAAVEGLKANVGAWDSSTNLCNVMLTEPRTDRVTLLQGGVFKGVVSYYMKGFRLGISKATDVLKTPKLLEFYKNRCSLVLQTTEVDNLQYLGCIKFVASLETTMLVRVQPPDL